jgi:hypothetical protein
MATATKTNDVTFELKEVCIFTPINGEGSQEATITALPIKGKTKYTCLLADGGTVPINPCYLSKKTT